MTCKYTKTPTFTGTILVWFVLTYDSTAIKLEIKGKARLIKHSLSTTAHKELTEINQDNNNDNNERIDSKMSTTMFLHLRYALERSVFPYIV